MKMSPQTAGMLARMEFRIVNKGFFCLTIGRGAGVRRHLAVIRPKAIPGIEGGTAVASQRQREALAKVATGPGKICLLQWERQRMRIECQKRTLNQLALEQGVRSEATLRQSIKVDRMMNRLFELEGYSKPEKHSH